MANKNSSFAPDSCTNSVPNSDGRGGHHVMVCNEPLLRREGLWRCCKDELCCAVLCCAGCLRQSLIGKY